MNDRVWLAYSFNPAASGNVTLDHAATAAASAYFVFELGNVDTSATVDITSTNSITTTVDNRFVTYFQGVNNDPGASIVPAAGSIITIAGAGDAPEGDAVPPFLFGHPARMGCRMAPRQILLGSNDSALHQPRCRKASRFFCRGAWLGSAMASSVTDRVALPSGRKGAGLPIRIQVPNCRLIAPAHLRTYPSN